MEKEEYYLSEKDIEDLANNRPVEFVTKDNRLVILHNVNEEDLSEDLISQLEV